jgi:hypothetical protein
MIAHEDSRRGFRAVVASALEVLEGEEDKARLVAPAGVIEALGLEEGAPIDALPLP